MAQGDFYKLAIVGRFGLGQMFVNTFHYRQDAILALQDGAQVLAERFAQSYLEGYDEFIVSGTVVDRVEVRQLTNPPLSGFDVALGINGTATGVQLPPQVCPLIQERTGQLGRDQHGRVYLPAGPVTQQDAGQMGLTWRNSMKAWAEGCMQITDVTGLLTLFQLVVYHPASQSGSDVVAITIANDMATHRSRRVGNGS